MGTKFGGSYPALYNKGSDRDRMMLIASAGVTISLLVAIAVVVNYRRAAKPESGKAPITAPIAATVSVLTSDSFVRAGAPLSQMRFQETTWPRNSMPEGAIRDSGELRGKYAKSDIPPGTPLQLSHLSDEVGSGPLAITPGMRAVTIEVDQKKGVDGFALPGTRVDVILTYKVGEELTSKVIVQNARVLSSDGDSTTPTDRTLGSSKKTKTMATVTLETSPNDALKVATAVKMGSLTLFMRAAEDDKATAAVQVNQNALDKESGKSTKKQECNRGVMRIEGKEYIIDCDGQISEMMNSDEP